MDGILPLFKERNMTSNDAVIKCRRIFKTKRVGHSGTLDPNVDGVLPICIGKATKVVNYLMESGKKYRGQVTLGFATTTEDLDGEIVSKSLIEKPFSDSEIQKVMDSMTGNIVQIPPMYSAVKVNGKRLYEYARAGETVERPQRHVNIKSFKMIGESEFDENQGLQKINFEVECSKGTYVRTLAVDLGKKLGVSAVMSDLTRLQSGGFDLSQTISLSELENADNLEDKLFPISYALKGLDSISLTDFQWKIVKNGGFLQPKYLKKSSPVIVLNYKNKTRAVYKFDEDKKVYKPQTMIDLTD
ncbi:tRNA pseudouridine(55) synthase TruB [Ligilactobacillus cholophilus]|uniref:tRNA pseudouridine(55) synthase TruB n=1 Tax=Ligilactobacillus cholophilus TaxID=3050131 RepID=UPI0025B07F74|nr:tRNA pseudouridine(55) synthase TruB [Ligilactobacillus cholophilus]